MAQKLTAAEQKTLAAAQAQIKKLQSAIAKNDATIKTLTPPTVNSGTAVQKLTSGQPLTDAEKKALGISVTPTSVTPVQTTMTADDIWATQKVGNTGKTQAQLDAEAGAKSTVDSINSNTSVSGVTATIDPKTGLIVGKTSTGKIIGTPPPGSTVDNPLDNPVYAAMLAALNVYNISGLSDTLLAIRTAYPDITSEDMLSLLRYDKRYNAGYLQRFAGNAKLAAAGKPTLDEKTYLANEAAYAKIFKAYDVTRFANSAQYAELIGNEIAPTEVSSRVSMAYDRILNADSNVLLALRKFGSSLSTGDLIAAMLDPRNQLPELNKKITSAEIGGAALKQGLQAYEAATSMQSSRYSNLTEGTIGTTAAMQSGADAASANKDYQAIAGELPRMEFLSSISKGLPQYGQVEAEQARIQGLASAQRKQEKLLEAEAARFSGSSGNAPGAFSTGYLKRSSSAGQF